jgi:hypothetical protein
MLCQQQQQQFNLAALFVNYPLVLHVGGHHTSSTWSALILRLRLTALT